MNPAAPSPPAASPVPSAPVQPLLLYQYLDEAEARAVAQALTHLPDDAHLEVRIHSVGGDIYSGLAIYNQLMAARQRGLRIDVRIDGLAASMASVVAMAGQRIRMAENAELMVHNPWTRIEGDSTTLRTRAEQLDRLKTQLVQIYAQRSQQTETRLAELMDVERWFTAAEAKALGLVDEVIAPRLIRKRVAENAAPDARHQAYRPPSDRRTRREPTAAPARVPTPPIDVPPATQAETEALRAELARLQDQLAQHRLEAQLLAAVRDGRIAQAQVAPLAALGQLPRGLPQVEAYLQTLPAMPRLPRLAAQLVPYHGAPPTGRPALDPTRADWTLRDWEKHDPNALARLRRDQPEFYARLYEATYRTPQ